MLDLVRLKFLLFLWSVTGIDECEYQLDPKSSPVTVYQYPYFVQIFNGLILNCNGAILNQKTVITSGKCYNKRGYSSYFIFVGDSIAGKGQEHLISKNASFIDGNIILLLFFVSKPFIYSNEVKNIELPSSKDILDLGQCALECSMIYQPDEIFGYTTCMLEYKITIKSYSECLESTHQIRYDEKQIFLCAGKDISKQKQGSIGVTGTPLIRDQKLFGIYYERRPSKPEIFLGHYVKIPDYIKWINETISKNMDKRTDMNSEYENQKFISLDEWFKFNISVINPESPSFGNFCPAISISFYSLVSFRSCLGSKSEKEDLIVFGSEKTYLVETIVPGFEILSIDSSKFDFVIVRLKSKIEYHENGPPFKIISSYANISQVFQGKMYQIILRPKTKVMETSVLIHSSQSCFERSNENLFPFQMSPEIFCVTLLYETLQKTSYTNNLNSFIFQDQNLLGFTIWQDDSKSGSPIFAVQISKLVSNFQIKFGLEP